MDQKFLEEMENFFNERLEDLDFYQSTYSPVKAQGGGDIVDQLNAEVDNAFQLKIKKRNSAYRQKLIAAMEKIQNKTYGHCEECGEEIGEQRLRARPTAQMCICCKEELEGIENSTADSPQRVLSFSAKNPPTSWSATACEQSETKGLSEDWKKFVG